jgi:hypothetical protein
MRSDTDLAGTARERVLGRAESWTLSLPRLSTVGWVAPALLALATALAIVAAYSVRPAVAIDLGDYYDTPFLPNAGSRGAVDTDFFAPEIGTIGPEQPNAWPATQTTLELAGRRAGVWQATVEAAAGQLDGALADVTLTVNDVRMSIARRGPRQFVAIIPAEVAAAERLALRLDPALNGDPAPPAGLAGRVLLAPARTYRWSSDRSTISLPGLGRGDWTVTLNAILRHPDQQPLDTTIVANGVPIARLPDNGPRRLALFVPAALMPDGDLTLTITSNTFKDPRPLGALLYDLRVAPAGPGALLPPLSSLLYGLIAALCLYVCLLRMTGRAALAAALALAVVVAGAWVLATARYPTAFMLPRMAALAAWSIALLLALERLLPWVFRRTGVPLSGWALRGLLLIFFAGYWLKAGGMLYPYFTAKDVAWHMTRVQWIIDGRLALLYGVNSPLNESTMPAAEWGAFPPVIPYSPWFHMFATSFALLPLSLVLTANMFSALVDGSRVFLLALLGRKIGLDERASLMAGLLYAVTPATYLLHSWGNIPTTFGMWWTLVSTVYIVVAYRRLDRPWPFAILTLLLTATLLFYTPMAAFMLLFLGLLIAGLWFIESKKRVPSEPEETRRDGHFRALGSFFADRPALRPVAALALATVAALGIATLIYYGQYIPPIVERTIPYFLQAAAPGTSAGLQRRDPFLVYLANYWPRMAYLRSSGAYGLQLALPLGILGMFAVRERRIRLLLGCWLAVAGLFVVIGARISMVDKQVFYIIPALALGVGLVAGRLWQRGLPARLVVAGLYLFVFVAALQMWIYRIATVR